MHLNHLLLSSAALLSACSSTLHNVSEVQDPSKREVRLASDSDWNASLVIDNDGTGIWTVAVLNVFPQYGCPEIVGLDDKGRCNIMVGYSGKWTPVTTIADGTWLGAIAQGNIDSRIDGPELYTGGKRGNLYQVVTHREGIADNRRIAHIPGREIHTLIAADLIPEREGTELIAFTRPGGLYLLTPRAKEDGFDVRHIEDLAGRVRDAAWIPSLGAVATVDRVGRLQLLNWSSEGPQWRTIFERPMGMGRIAHTERDGNVILYNTCDDGTIWRHAALEDGSWSHKLIHTGSQGPRGIVSGRFDQNASVETIALFGYGARVELLTHNKDGWQVETLFTDRDKGHWLTKGELDGRNATDELVLSGYGARVVLLSRPPGFGLQGATKPELEAHKTEPIRSSKLD